MKTKMAKIISVFLAMLMICTLLPTMAFAANEQVTLGTTKLKDATLEQGTPSSYNFVRNNNGGSASKSIGESGIYQRLPLYTYGSYSYSPVNYGVPVVGSVEVSNEGVIGNCKFSLAYYNNGNVPGLQFSYTALKAGTTTVKLTFFYNFGLVGVDTTWHQETTTFTVNVDNSTVTKPGKPSTSTLKKFQNYVNSTSSSKGAVYIWCSDFDHQAWFDYVTEVPGGYTLGEVVANDGHVSAADPSAYPWMCPMTIDAQAYVDAYNYELGSECGTHYLAADEPKTQTVYWFYKGGSWYFVTSDAPVYIDVTHNAPTTFSVTYTDGVDGKEIFADQVTTGLLSGTATPAFTGSLDRDGYVFKGWSPAVADTVTGNATYTATWEATVWASNDKKVYAVNDTITITVRTGADVEKVYLVSESGMGLVSNRSSKPNDDGSVTWTLTLSLATKGDRTLSVYTDGKDTGVDVSFMVSDGTVIPDSEVLLFDASIEETGKINEPITATVKTSTSIAKIRLFNENGMGLAPTNCTYVDEEGVRTWTYQISVGTPGSRTFTVKVAGYDMAWADETETVQVRVTR